MWGNHRLWSGQRDYSRFALTPSGSPAKPGDRRHCMASSNPYWFSVGGSPEWPLGNRQHATYCCEIGRGNRIRTCDPLVPNQMRYQTAPCPDPGPPCQPGDNANSLRAPRNAPMPAASVACHGNQSCDPRFRGSRIRYRLPFTIRATCSAMASDAVNPGDSIPKRLTRPATPCWSGPSMRKSAEGSLGPDIFGRIPA